MDNLTKTYRMNHQTRKFSFQNYQLSNSNNEYRFEILGIDKNVIGTAHVKFKNSSQGNFWHLDDLYIFNNYRFQGYGTKLLNHLREYVWNINRLKLRVHPAIGQQAMEEIAAKKLSEQSESSEEELDAMDEKLEREMMQPDFWKKQKETSSKDDSTSLVKWYMDRGFSVRDPDEKHLWCEPN